MPRPKPMVRKYADLGELQELLIACCPPDLNSGVQSIPRLAMLLDIERASVYWWIKNKRVPPDRVDQIIALGKGKLTLAGETIKREHFFPYVFGS